MGRIPLVHLEMRSRGFKAWIIFFTSAIGTSIVALDQPWDSIDELGRNGEGLKGGECWKGVCGRGIYGGKRGRCGSIYGQEMEERSLYAA
ncbi:hypothetical protein Tco_1409180 [Tanacetum coccineum]